MGSFQPHQLFAQIPAWPSIGPTVWEDSQKKMDFKN